MSLYVLLENKSGSWKRITEPMHKSIPAALLEQYKKARPTSKFKLKKHREEVAK